MAIRQNRGTSMGKMYKTMKESMVKKPSVSLETFMLE